LRNGFAHDFALTVCEPRLVFLPNSEGTSCEEASVKRLPFPLAADCGVLL
jgi:hypothetical protein